jgi:hypothetical protein
MAGARSSARSVTPEQGFANFGLERNAGFVMGILIFAVVVGVVTIVVCVGHRRLPRPGART